MSGSLLERCSSIAQTVTTSGRPRQDSRSSCTTHRATEQRGRRGDCGRPRLPCVGQQRLHVAADDVGDLAERVDEVERP